MNNEQEKTQPAFDKKAMLIPALIVTVGVGWLLSSLGIAPQIDWIWTGGLAVVGVMTFVICRIDKFSVVIGPFFLAASFMSVLRQMERISLNVEVPCLVIILGVFLGIAQLPAVKVPDWFHDGRPKY